MYHQFKLETINKLRHIYCYYYVIMLKGWCLAKRRNNKTYRIYFQIYVVEFEGENPSRRFPTGTLKISARFTQILWCLT